MWFDARRNVHVSIAMRKYERCQFAQRIGHNAIERTAHVAAATVQ